MRYELYDVYSAQGHCLHRGLSKDFDGIYLGRDSLGIDHHITWDDVAERGLTTVRQSDGYQDGPMAGRLDLAP